MTRKDYVMIAETIREALGDIASTGDSERLSDDGRTFINGERAGVRLLALRLAEQLHSENTRFDRTRFIEACSLTA